MLQCVEYDSFFLNPRPKRTHSRYSPLNEILSLQPEKKNLLSIDLEVEEWVIPQQPFCIVKPSISQAFMDFANT